MSISSQEPGQPKSPLAAPATEVEVPAPNHGAPRDRENRGRGRAWLLPTVTGVIGFVLGVGVVGGAVAVRAAAVEREEAAAAEAAALAEAAAVMAAEQELAEARAALAGLLPDALDLCGVTGWQGFDLGDGDLTLTFNMKGEDEFSGAAYPSIACVFEKLDMPSQITSHIQQTTSMDGRQTAEWDDFSISWSYHPDRGLDGVVTVVER